MLTEIFSGLGAIEFIIVLVLLAGGLGFVMDWVSRYRGPIAAFFSALPFYLVNIYTKYVVFAFFLSIALFILLVIYVMKERKIRKKIMDKVTPSEGEIESNSKDTIMENPKWKLVNEHINSDDANKWKLAVIEADIILSELLDTLNLQGNGVGEKLKNVEKGDFEHIEEAWEAHKIRNAIAHEGSDFLLTQREAKRVIELFRSVFEEFEII